MKNTFFFSTLFFVVCAGVWSCKKGPGEGGKASIHGKVMMNKYNNSFTVYQGNFADGGDNVYIIYGDHITYDNSVKTNYDGTFEFPFLRTGDYTVYVYSRDSTKSLNGVPNPNGAVISSKLIANPIAITISGKKDKVDAGTITVLK